MPLLKQFLPLAAVTAVVTFFPVLLLKDGIWVCCADCCEVVLQHTLFALSSVNCLKLSPEFFLVEFLLSSIL